MRLCCVRQKLLDIAEVWQCLENKPLESFVIGVTIFDQIWSTVFLLPSAIVEFLYVNSGGKSGFVDKKWISYVDIYSFRRFHDWEIDKERGVPLEVIDWTEQRIYINETRTILDEKCSVYENNIAIPGDPGDYLREVAGRPISSGYNTRIALIVKLWLTSMFLIYFTTPALLVAVWWRRQRGRIIATYIFLQVITMLLLVAICFLVSEHLMCAINVIYDRHYISAYLYVFTTIFWVYQILKFLLVELYVIEMHLIRKRKDYGFRKGRRSVRVTPMGGNDYVDVEKVVETEKKMFNRITSSDKHDTPLTGKMLARELLELGGTTEDESTAEKLKRHSKKKHAFKQAVAAKTQLLKRWKGKGGGPAMKNTASNPIMRVVETSSGSSIVTTSEAEDGDVVMVMRKEEDNATSGMDINN